MYLYHYLQNVNNGKLRIKISISKVLNDLIILKAKQRPLPMKGKGLTGSSINKAELSLGELGFIID